MPWEVNYIGILDILKGFLVLKLKFSLVTVYAPIYKLNCK